LAIFNRIPKREQIAAVYSVIVLVIYTWTMLAFLWRVSGWLYFLNIPEILIALGNTLAVNFLESLMVLIVPVVLAVILPKKWFADAFVARGVTLVLPLLIYMIYVAYQLEDTDALDYPNMVLNLAPVVFIASLVLAFFIGKISIIRKAIENFADRSIIFLYISIPASIISVLMIIFLRIF
jgi:hypothetical protein